MLMQDWIFQSKICLDNLNIISYIKYTTVNIPETHIIPFKMFALVLCLSKKKLRLIKKYNKKKTKKNNKTKNIK